MSSPADSQTLDSEFSYTFANLEQDAWHCVLEGFQDASVFQTTPFCTAKSKSVAVEHLVLRRGTDVAAAAQIRVIPVPFARASIAYVLWGPLCHRWKRDRDWGALHESLRRLRQEYVVNRQISLRIAPLFTRDQEQEWGPLFESEGYAHAARQKTRRTIIIDLERSLDDLRKGLEKKWRNCLNRAERSNLELREGCDDAMFEIFLVMYREMLARKRLAEPGDIQRFRAMQSMLPARFKMKVFVVFEKGEPSAGAICSAIGRRGLYLFGATADIGMKNKASYLVQWRVIEWLKEVGCAEYDLHGSHPESNPGVYAFKKGLCGKNGKEVEFAGPFDAYNGVRSRFILKIADRANHGYKRLKSVYEKYRGFTG